MTPDIHLGEKNYKCKICMEAFKDPQTMKLHVMKVHEGVKFKCDLCNGCFHNKQGIKRHKLKIHGIGEDDVKKSDKTP